MKVDSAPRSISYPMDSLPLMQSLFKVLNDQDRFILQAVVNRDFSALPKLLVNFKPLVGVLFLDGWEVYSAFEALAKPE